MNGKMWFLRRRHFSETQKRFARNQLLVLPSVFFKGFPMVILETIATWVPIAASRLGSRPCLALDGRNGVLFDPGNSEDLLRLEQAAWGEDDLLARMGTAAHEEFEVRYSAEPNFQILTDIYQAAIERRRRMAERVEVR